MKSRDEFVQDLKKKLDEWNGEIAEAEKKFEAASDEASQQYASQIAEMKKRWADAEEQMRVAGAKSMAEWEKRGQEFEAAWKDIAGGFTKAFSRFS